MSVSDRDAEVRVHFADGVGDGVDGLYAVVQVEDLPATIDFCADGVLYDGGLIALDDGFDGSAIGGRGFNDGHRRAREAR